MRGWRIGFGARLFLAFSAVGVMTVAASVIAWLAFNRLSVSLDGIARDSLPAMERATRLADAGGSLIATAPTLAAASSDDDRRHAWDSLARLLTDMDALVVTMAEHPTEAGNAPELRRLIEGIRSNLFALNSNVTQRLLLIDTLGQRMERLRWTHADFLDEVEPMIEDVRFTVARSFEGLRQSAQPEYTTLLREERLHAALLDVNAAGNLMVGLIARSVGLSSPDGIADATIFMGEMADRLRKNLTAITDLPGASSVRQISESLLGFAEGENSVPALRRRELAAQGEGQALLASNRGLVERLRTSIARQVEEVHASTAAAAARSAEAISGGRVMLIGTVFISLLFAVLVAWLYVGRSLVARVTALGQSMRAIAAGDLETPVLRGGRDEIADMAEALLVFRNTAIAVEEANAQSIIENTVAGLLTTDERGFVETVNPTARRLFTDAQSIQGKPFEDLLDPKAMLPVRAFFATNTTTSTGTALFVADACIIRADGARLAVDLAIRAFHQRTRRRFIVTLQDVSERAQAQELLERRVAERTAQLHASNKQLRTEVAERERVEAEIRQTQNDLVQAGKLAALGEMAAGIAHELNQPLAAIRSYAHNAVLLLERGRADDARTNLGKIEDLTERMARISHHLKTVARRPAETLGPVDLRATALSALSLFDGRIAQEAVALVNLIPAEVRVLAEPIRLQQVLVNLIANALDAMREVEERRLILDARRQEGRIVLTIADTGAGMAEATRARLFDPFFTTKEVGRGLGLGLSISYNIVKDFGGAIALDSEEGRGSVFALTLQET